METLKQNVRDQIRTSILNLTSDERSASSAAILAHLKQYLEGFVKSRIFKTPRLTMGAFKALATEPNLSFEQIDCVQWAYPKTQNGVMNFFTEATHFEKSEWGVYEPVDGHFCSLNDMAGVVVPALGFSKQGFRLGRGKGFFDKTFEQFKEIKIGVCFDFTYSENIPYEKHDIKMNYIITDKQVVETEKPVALGEV